MPKRVQIQSWRKPGGKKPENTVIVARPSNWGNPYRIGAVYPDEGIIEPLTQERAVSLYEEWLRGKSVGAFFAKGKIRRELRGKDLACYCKPDDPCHADILLDIANK